MSALREAPPPNTIRVALASVPWPPNAASSRDAATIAGAVRAYRVVSAKPGRIVLRRGRTTLVFRRMSPVAALRAFRGGELDEAPVPVGDVGFFRGSVGLHVRPLRLVDALVFESHVPAGLRRAYAATAARDDYAALLTDARSRAAVAADPAGFRRALREIPSLPRREVRVAIPQDPALQYGARLLVAEWRQVGLGPRLVPAAAAADARLVRVAHPPRDSIRVARAVDARLVSPRLRGWRENARGVVDYTRVRVHPRASS